MNYKIKNFLSTSHKLSSISNDIAYQLNNYKYVPYTLQTFSNTNLPEICKMNNANLKFHDTNIKDNYLSKYDLFDSHKMYLLTNIFSNCEKFIVHNNDSHLLNNIKILEEKYVRDYLINFIKVQKDVDVNILNTSEINYLCDNVKYCIDYLIEKNKVLNDNSILISKNLNSTNIFKPTNDYHEIDQGYISKFKNMCDFTYELHFDKNNISSLKFYLLDVLKNEVNSDLLKQYECDNVVEYMKYVCCNIYYNNNPKSIYDVDLIQNPEYAFLNFNTFGERKKKILDFALDYSNAEELLSYIEELNIFIDYCRNILNNYKLEKSDFIWTIGSTKVANFISSNFNVILHTKLLLPRDIYNIVIRINIEIDKTNKIIDDLNQLYESII